MFVRFSTPTTYACSSSNPVSGAAGIDYRGFSAGEVYVPATGSLTTLTWWVSQDGSNWYPAYDGAGNAVQSTGTFSTAGGQAIPIPLTLFGAAWILAVGNQAVTVTVNLKG